ncbi:MAG: hypothetical protein ACOY40_09265 [Bacillota bacterium]
MIATVTTTTTAVITTAGGGILASHMGMMVVISLIVLLIVKELAGAYLQEAPAGTAVRVVSNMDQALQVGIIPFLFVFAVIVINRVLAVLT